MKKGLLFILAFAGFSICTKAQWVEQNVGITTGHYVNYISIPNDSVVWGTTVDGSVATPTPTRRWVRSIDGGTTFTTGLVTGASTAYDASCISAVNKDTAWVAMFNSGGGGRIYRTINGGAAWAVQSTAAFAAPAGFPNVVHFWNGLTGYAMGDPNGGYFEIYTTVDAGTTWTRVPTGNIPAPLTGEYGYTNLHSVVGDTIWFGTNMGRVYRSIDKGMNWTVSATIFSDLGDVEFTNSTDGIVRSAGTAAIQSTTDGGLTWSDVIYSGTLFSIDIASVPGTTGMYISTGEDPAATGTFGSSYTLDNGVTWTTLDANTHINARFKDINTGWSGGISAGATGGIYKWSGIPSGILAGSEDSEGLNVYPNPNNGIFKITINSVEKENTVTVYDLVGKVVLTKTFNTIGQTINISDQSKGVYFVKVQNGNQVQTKKIILQ
jgi:hypothetical protein